MLALGGSLRESHFRVVLVGFATPRTYSYHLVRNNVRAHTSSPDLEAGKTLPQKEAMELQTKTNKRIHQ